ncbi:MAG: c-type cytochrome [Neomegalonema sp.]|nr:c-type cytochrome [Neomegalonema sp.]
MAWRRPLSSGQARSFVVSVAVAAGALAAQVGALAAKPAYTKLEGHGGPVKGVVSLAGGAQALSASFDYALGYWDLKTGSRLAWLEGHRAAVNAVATTPDGAFALSASDDFSLILWDLAAARSEKPAQKRRLLGHKGKVAAVAIAPNGKRAASAGWDGIAIIWSLPDGARRVTTAHYGASITAVAFEPAGGRIITGDSEGRIRRWDADSAAPIDVLAEHGFAIASLVTGRAHRTDAWVAFGAADGGLRIIDLQSGREEARFAAERSPVLALAVAPSGRLLAAGDGLGRIRLYERTGRGAAATWRRRADFRGAWRGPVWSLAFAGPTRLLAAGLDPSIAVWPLDRPVAPPPVLAAGKKPGFQVDPKKVSNGERQFLRKCSACHTLTPDGGRRAGPTLYRLFGREAGSVKGYKYSKALASSRLIWTPKTLDALFDIGPDHYTPGSKMPMQRITRLKDRSDLVAFLKRATAPGAATSE